MFEDFSKICREIIKDFHQLMHNLIVLKTILNLH
jgi:hypothetical protein